MTVVGGLVALLLAVAVLPTLLIALVASPPIEARLVLYLMAAVTGLFTLALVIGGGLAVNRIEYRLSDEALEIRVGPWRGPVLPLESIRRAWSPEEVHSSDWSSSVGIRLPGLYIATVRPPGVGAVTLYATRRDRHLVVLETATRRYGVSPEDPAAFLGALQEKLGEKRGTKPGTALSSAGGEAVRRNEATGSGTAVLASLGFAAAALAVAGGLAVWRSRQMPAVVPLHFNVAGQVDRWGSPGQLMAGVWAVLGAGLLATGLGGWLGMREREPSLRLLVVGVTLLGAMLTAATALAMVWTVPL